mmetsp:Transcript_7324/g.17931  ORF Transcript_7324/g.17931 Transcript_7324/m.17931 type:complete len:344 (-) Transcript_7324:213-1244(-)
MRRAERGRAAPAPRARGRPPSRAAVRQPDRGAARRGGAGPAGVRHGPAAHHGGRVAPAPGQPDHGMDQHHLRVQRAVHVLRRAQRARAGAEPHARGDPRGSRAGGCGGVPRDRAAWAEHRRVRARPTPARQLHGPARVRARRARDRADPIRDVAPALHDGAADPEVRGAVQGDGVLPRAFPERERQGAARDVSRVHCRAVPADRGTDPPLLARRVDLRGRDRGVPGGERGGVPGHAGADGARGVRPGAHCGVLAAAAHAGGGVGHAGGRGGEVAAAARDQRADQDARGAAVGADAGAGGGGAGGGEQPEEPGGGVWAEPPEQARVLRGGRGEAVEQAGERAGE